MKRIPPRKLLNVARDLRRATACDPKPSALNQRRKLLAHLLSDLAARGGVVGVVAPPDAGRVCYLPASIATDLLVLLEAA